MIDFSYMKDFLSISSNRVFSKRIYIFNRCLGADLKVKRKTVFLFLFFICMIMYVKQNKKLWICYRKEIRAIKHCICLKTDMLQVNAQFLN